MLGLSLSLLLILLRLEQAFLSVIGTKNMIRQNNYKT